MVWTCWMYWVEMMLIRSSAVWCWRLLEQGSRYRYVRGRSVGWFRMEMKSLAASREDARLRNKWIRKVQGTYDQPKFTWKMSTKVMYMVNVVLIVGVCVQPNCCMLMISWTMWHCGTTGMSGSVLTVQRLLQSHSHRLHQMQRRLHLLQLIHWLPYVGRTLSVSVHWFLLHCTWSLAAQCIVIGPVCGHVCNRWVGSVCLCVCD